MSYTGGSLRIHYGGAAMTRTDKIEYILSQWDERFMPLTRMTYAYTLIMVCNNFAQSGEAKEVNAALDHWSMACNDLTEQSDVCIDSIYEFITERRPT